MSVVETLHRKLNHFTVNLANWEIPNKGVTVLWGPSGSGKTTILNSLLGIDQEAEVVWRWDQELISSMNSGQRNLGVVFQDPGLFPHLSVKKNIMFPVNKKKHPHWQEDYNYLCETLEIEHCLQSPIHEISGGERQRVALARALIYRPRMLLMDEPFSSLDGVVKSKVRHMVKSLCDKFECPLLLVTHDTDDVQFMANKVTEIDKGQIVKESNSLSPK